MLTQCPNPSCAHSFELNDSLGINVGNCPLCGQIASFRSLDGMRQLEKLARQRIESGLWHGGPVIEAGKPAVFSAVLENVRSLWNVGSIFRSADGAGCSSLYLCGITGCPPRKEIAKTSLGAESYVSWQYNLSALEVLPALKALGVLIIGLEYTDESQPLPVVLKHSRIDTPLCLIVGNEDKGISAESLDLCDYVVHLPMRGVKTSLNVAVAFGVAAYYLADHCRIANSREALLLPGKN